MENYQIMSKEKLSFSCIIKEALKIPTKKPSFIFLTFLTSLPLFCFLLSQEILFQQALIQEFIQKFSQEIPFQQVDDFIISQKPITMAFSCQPRPFCLAWSWSPFDAFFIVDLISAFTWRILSYGLLFYAIGHLLDLINTIIVVHTASLIYAGQDNIVSIKEMISRPFKKVGFKGPLITSIYALVLASLTYIGLISIAAQIIFTADLFSVFFGLAFIGLFIKCMEWSAVWNMGMVISVLEEKHGDVALGVSAYISRGSRKRGFLLFVLFFVWRLVLRLAFFYVGLDKGRGVLVEVTIGQICLVCLGNMMKWAVFTVYFYDCKRRFLEKKVDVEQGRVAQTQA